jgi:hypothetical protein
MIDIFLAKKLAYEHNVELSVYAKDIIEDIIANEGYCPIKVKCFDSYCPCYAMLVHKQCIYDLFISKD